MKGEAEAQCLFFFRQPFDEKMMNVYHAAKQNVIPCIHRIIAFIAHHRFYGNTVASTLERLKTEVCQQEEQRQMWRRILFVCSVQSVDALHRFDRHSKRVIALAN